MGVGGESGIRTHGTLSRTHAFQACALSRSAISPAQARLHTIPARPCKPKPSPVKSQLFGSHLAEGNLVTSLDIPIDSILHKRRGVQGEDSFRPSMVDDVN